MTDHDRALPLTPYQHALWLAERMHPESRAFYATVPMRLRGDVDAAALEHAWESFCALHEATRMSFHDTDEGPVQILGDRPACEVISRREDARGALLEDVVLRELHRPYDLSRAASRLVHLALADDDHVVLLCNHHLAFDLVSTAVMLKQLPVLYAAIRSGAAPPELERSHYASFAQRPVEADALSSGREWARRRLANIPKLELPHFARHRTGRGSDGAADAATHAFSLGSELPKMLAEAGIRPLHALTAAWSHLLGRHTGQRELCVGTPADVRPRPEHQRAVGDFVNLLAVRLDVDGSASLSAASEAVRASLKDALAHRTFPILSAVEASAGAGGPLIETSVSFNDLPQLGPFSAFMLRGAPWSATFAGHPVSPFPVAQQEGHYPLSFWAAPVGDAWWAELKYRPSLFDAAEVEVLSEQLTRLLLAAARSAHRPLSRIEIMSERGRAHVRALGGAPAPHEARPWLADRVRAHAAREPDAPAIVSGDATTSYGELLARAERIAGALGACGVTRGSAVVLCAAASADLIAAQLATWLLGAYFVSLDASLPLERVRWICADVAAARIVADGERAGELGALTFAELVEGAPTRAHGPDAPGSAPAYVIYTSGSTGAPKGVIVPHRGIARTCDNKIAYFDLKPSTPQTLLASMGFDASMFEIWPALACGATLHIVPEAIRADVVALADFFRRHAISHAFLPTPLGELFLELSPDLPVLRSIAVAGDTLRLRPSPTLGFAVHNLYGPTEASVWSTAEEVRADERGTILIGRPVDGVTAQLVDATGGAVPFRAEGELLLGGDVVATGYVGRPRLTAEVFVPAELGAPGSRAYRSGDRAAWTDDGRLEFLGRRDGQVKIRGQRIELGEVESTIRRVAGVAEVAVTAPKSAGTDRFLCAYAVLEPRATLEGIQQEVRRLLPAAMVPSRWAVLEALPLSPAGKLDRKRLPPIDEWSEASDAVPLECDEERVVLDAMQRILGAPRLHPLSSFSQHGGHSVAAAALSLSLRREGIDVSIGDIVHGDTPRAIVRQSGRRAAIAPAHVWVEGESGSSSWWVLACPDDGEAERALAEALAPAAVLVVKVNPTSPHAAALLSDAARRELPAGARCTLAGWSACGVVAVQSAAELEASGFVVDRFVLFDTVEPSVLDAMLQRSSDTAWLAHDLAAAHDAPELLAATSIAELATALTARGHTTTAHTLTDRIDTLRSLARSMHAASVPVAHPVVVVRAADRAADTILLVDDLGWRGVAPSVRVVTTAGNHYSMRRPPNRSDLLAIARKLASTE